MLQVSHLLGAVLHCKQATMVARLRIGGIMRIGSLVKTPVNGVGIIIDTKTVPIGDYRGNTAYLLHYINGTKHWWTEDHLEVTCE